MRPRLDPMMGIVPISARVAIQWAFYNYRHRIGPDDSPSGIVRQAMADLPPSGFGMLRFALHSLSVYLDLQWNSMQWLSKVLEQAHYGSSFRRCFFFAYKETRSPYPRVTNRGVQNSSEAASARVKKGRVNA